MKFGIITRIGPETLDINLSVDRQYDLQLGLNTDADISLRGFGESLARNGIVPSTLAEELLVMAATVFIADTRIDRGRGDDGWTREIALSIPVTDVALWQGAAKSLQDALRFLTGDMWTLHFRSTAVSLELVKTQQVASPPVEGSAVSLFSGGLDSFVGALDLIATGKPTVLVGHYTDGSVSKPQDDAFSHVSSVKAKDQDLRLTRAWLVAPNDIFGEGNDDQQRSRSILFLALGVLVSDSLKSQELLIPENGLISLNVPLNDLRIGSYSTRTTHPHFIHLFQDALSSLGLRIHLHNPYQFKTKGEMLAECKMTTGLIDAAALTMSCAHPTAGRWAYKGAPAFQHCGRCFACLIRRAAFLHAFGSDPTPYTEQDLRASELPSDTARGRDVRAARLAAQRIMESPRIADLLVLKPGPLREHYAAYSDLYVRGMRELWQLIEHVKTRGAY